VIFIYLRQKHSPAPYLQSLNLIKYYKQQHLIYVTPQIIAEHQAKRRVTKGPALDQSKLHWAPPLTMAKSRK
jgi:hypothetical protein